MIKWENLHNFLIENRLVKIKEIGIESHHIIPKHAGGTNDPNNLVLLKRRDHILIHYIRYRWLKEMGDKIAYCMMNRTVVNVMHIPEVYQKLKDKMQTPETKQKLRDKANLRFEDPKERQKVSEHRKKYIAGLTDITILTDRLNTESAKAKRIISFKKWIVENPELKKQASLKGAQTIKENNKFLTKEQRSIKYNKGSGVENPKWRGAYKLINENEIEYIFSTRTDLKKSTGIGDGMILKYVNTDKIIFNRGKNKKWNGFKLYRSKEFV